MSSEKGLMMSDEVLLDDSGFFEGDQSVKEHLGIYATQLVMHSDQKPLFYKKMNAALKWIDDNPDTFHGMLEDLDYAAEFLYTISGTVDKKLLPNILKFTEIRHPDETLPSIADLRPENLQDSRQPVPRPGADTLWSLATEGELEPSEANFRGYHSFVESDEGLVATSLLDMYANNTHLAGLYPEMTNHSGLISNAITELLYSTRSGGALFKMLKDRTHRWIYGHPFFTDKFQALLYPESVEGPVNPRFQPPVPSDENVTG